MSYEAIGKVAAVLAGVTSIWSAYKSQKDEHERMNKLTDRIALEKYVMSKKKKELKAEIEILHMQIEKLESLKKIIKNKIGRTKKKNEDHLVTDLDLIADEAAIEKGIKKVKERIAIVEAAYEKLDNKMKGIV